MMGSGFRVPGSGFRVPGSGFRVPGSGFRVPGFRRGKAFVTEVYRDCEWNQLKLETGSHYS